MVEIKPYVGQYYNIHDMRLALDALVERVLTTVLTKLLYLVLDKATLPSKGSCMTAQGGHNLHVVVGESERIVTG